MVPVKILLFTIIINFLYSGFKCTLLSGLTPQKLDQTVFENVDDFTSITKKAQLFFNTLPETILEDASLLVPELIQKYGYPSESHTITTSDGYVLTIHRIPHGRRRTSTKFKPVVFVQHGILSSAADWVVLGPQKALGYLLADAGYDVWLGNARGTRYSRLHNTLSPDDPEFWQFSWHEIALEDVSAMIDYALNHTKQKDLFYIGHSQGNTVFYVLCSEKPEYNSKIKMQFSLSPVAYMDHITSPLLQFFARGELSLGTFGSLIGINEFLPSSKFLAVAGQYLCSDNSVTQILCSNSLFAICGFNEKQMNETLLPVIMGHTPAGASTKQLRHYGQQITSGRFQQYDKGYFDNIRLYNSSEPPQYKLENVVVPVYIYYSRNDWISHEIDVERLYTQLGNPKGKILIEDEKFNHIDYIYGIDANKFVYNSVLAILKNLK